MRVTLTGATGFVGSRLVDALKARDDEVTVLSRDAARARQRLGVNAVAWDWQVGPASAAALSGRDVVVHLAGEPVAQRWNATVKDRIRDSREHGTRQLVASLQSADPRPPRLVCASACAYYGAHREEVIDEASPAGSDWLADVCVRWEREAGALARLMVGEVAKYAVTGVRMVPGRAEELGYTFRYPGLDGALADTLTRNSE